MESCIDFSVPTIFVSSFGSLCVLRSTVEATGMGDVSTSSTASDIAAQVGFNAWHCLVMAGRVVNVQNILTNFCCVYIMWISFKG